MDSDSELDRMMESHEIYREIFNSIQDGIAVLDMDLNIIKLNQAMQDWYAKGKVFKHRKCFEVFHGKAKPCDKCAASKAIRTGQMHERTISRGGPRGTPGWIKTSAFPIKNSSGNTIGVVEFVRNVTKRKQAEQALSSSERNLKDIINFLPDPTFVIDKNGEVIQWNKAIEALSGISADDMVTKGNHEYAIPFYGERRPILIDLALHPDEPKENRYGYRRSANGKLGVSDSYHATLGKNGVYLSGSASPLYDSNGNITGAIETIRDITEMKLAAQQKEKLIFELKEALDKVKTLRGLLPICASCKKIRDDKGYWNQIESYLKQHSDAEFSHSMCPECADKLYGDQDWYIRMKKKKDPGT